MLEQWRDPPSHDEVEKRMLEFAEKLKRYVNEGVHSVAIAAWVHREIGVIHPFMDGNGRLARLLMNALLVRGGYEPVIFYNESTYTQATINDNRSPGAFAEFLSRLIREQAAGPQLFART